MLTAETTVFAAMLVLSSAVDVSYVVYSVDKSEVVTSVTVVNSGTSVVSSKGVVASPVVACSVLVYGEL